MDVRAAQTADAQLRPDGKNGVYVAPKVIRRRNVDHPDPRSDVQDAYVVHKFCVSSEGKVESLELLPEGFHLPIFVESAQIYVRGLVFEPATLDGVPISTCLVQPISFTISADGRSKGIREGVTPEFRRELDKATKLITSGDLAGAHHHTDYMLRDKVKLLYEYAVLQARLADTYARSGNPHRALGMARKATSRRDNPFPRVKPGDPLPANSFEQYLLPEAWIVQLMNMRISYAASNGLLADALQAYYELASLKRPEPTDDLGRQGQILEKALASGAELAGTIVIGEQGAWTHPLLRSAFTIDAVEGKVESLALSCDANVRELAYVADVEWKVPPNWRDCRLTINAEPDTKLRVVEFAQEG